MLKVIIPIAILAACIGSPLTQRSHRLNEIAEIERLIQLAENPQGKDANFQLDAALQAFELSQSANIDNAVKLHANIVLVGCLIEVGHNDRAFEKITEAAKYYKESEDVADQAMFNAHVGHLLVERGNHLEGIRHLRVAERLADGVVH